MDCTHVDKSLRPILAIRSWWTWDNHHEKCWCAWRDPGIQGKGGSGVFFAKRRRCFHRRQLVIQLRTAARLSKNWGSLLEQVNKAPGGTKSTCVEPWSSLGYAFSLCFWSQGRIFRHLDHVRDKRFVAQFRQLLCCFQMIDEMNLRHIYLLTVRIFIFANES